MQEKVFAATALLGLALAAPAAAQETERFSLERTQDGYVRLDTQTGEMSLCEERSGQLVCRFAAEQGEAYADQFDRLQQRIDALEERVAELEHEVGDTELPSEEEFEQTMSYMERFFRRFMGIVEDFDQTFGDEPAPGDQRT